MKEWYVEIEQNGGEYLGWVAFFANNVEEGDTSHILLVDGKEMTFDEKVVSFGVWQNNITQSLTTTGEYI